MVIINTNDFMDIEKNTQLLSGLKQTIQDSIESNISEFLKWVHSADLAEIANELSKDELLLVVKNLSYQKAARFISELETDDRKNILDNIMLDHLAYILEEMETDDAADILWEIDDEDDKNQVLKLIKDKQHVWEITELAWYQEWTAWALMAKEYVEVNKNWTIDECLTEVRRQAQEVERIHSVYIVDNSWMLIWRVSLKDLISAPGQKKVEEIRKKRVDYVEIDTPATEVAYLMEKYNMEAIPVIDHKSKLVGRITVDDVMDFVRDTAEENYNLASGILDDIEDTDKLRDMVKARLPWLVLALLGWLAAVSVMWGFEWAMQTNGELFFFTPLIAAMAGNVWVQSSALVVQWLANNSLKWWVFCRFLKEIFISSINWVLLSLLLLLFGYFIFGFDYLVIAAVCISLVCVILLASLIGTFVPLLLNRFGINPAMATWPFITTSNDIFGILIFFSIAKLIIGF